MKSTFSSMDSEMGKIGAMILSLSLSLSYTHTLLHLYTLTHQRNVYTERCCLSCQLLSQEDCFFLKLYLS